MANNAANLVGAQLLFGNMANNVFTADTKAQIQGDQDGSIRIETNTITVSGATILSGALTVGGVITGSLSGNATSATKLQNARNIGVSGDASGAVSFDGTANQNIPVTINSLRGVAVNTTGNVPVGTNRVNLEGYLYATRVYNAVWNDIADFIAVEDNTEIEFGKVYVKDTQGHRQSRKYAELGSIGIASDTYGFGVGQKDTGKQIPIAIGGFVLAYVDKQYPSGTPLVSSKNGGLTKASIFVKLFAPERILAIFYRNEITPQWNSITVNGRSWVRVR